MRPNKQINSGAHRAGTAAGGKGRYYSTGLPAPSDTGSSESVSAAPPAAMQPPTSKYDGRASVGPLIGDDAGEFSSDSTIELAHEQWVDPLDVDDFDLSTVTIDLRESRRPNPPETYYQRYSSKVPGHR